MSGVTEMVDGIIQAYQAFVKQWDRWDAICRKEHNPPGEAEQAWADLRAARLELDTKLVASWMNRAGCE